MYESIPPMSRRGRRVLLAVSLLLAVLAVIAGLAVNSNDGSASGQNASAVPQQASPTQTMSPSPTFTPTVTIPKDARVLLSESQARALTGVVQLHWVGSSGEEDRTGRLSSDTRYANNSYAYPDQALRYVEMSIYKGHTEYDNMFEQSFDANTGEHDWVFVSPQKYPQLTGAREAFVANRYARDGSVVRMLGFTFENVSLKVEVCNLPAAKLLDVAKVVISGLHKLDNVDSV